MSNTNTESSNVTPPHFNWKHPTCFDNASLLGQWAIENLGGQGPGTSLMDLGSGKCALINACSRLPSFHFLKAVDEEHYGSFCDSGCEFINQEIESYLTSLGEQKEDVIFCENVLNEILDEDKLSRILSLIFYNMTEDGSFLCSVFVTSGHISKRWRKVSTSNGQLVKR